MKWSWKITRIAGIDVYIHATFFILLIWIGLSYWQLEGNIAAVLVGLFYIVALFGCVVAHEFGHALTARRFGIVTRNITLLPIGGVASMEKMPEDPRQEILIALAGPAVNLFISLCLWVWLGISTPAGTQLTLSLTEGGFLQWLLIINLLLGVFNLLPAFPMDGGRVLRAALALRMDRARATESAARIGQGLALMLGFIGLMYNPFLLFIALFVWIGAAAESGVEQVKTTLGDIRLSRAMLTDFQSLAPDDALARAVELTLAGSQKDFPVLQRGEMVGVLTQQDLLKGLQQGGENAHIQQWMQTRVKQADADTPVKKVLETLQTGECALVGVTRAGDVVGIINLDNIAELIQIQRAIHEQSDHTDWQA